MTDERDPRLDPRPGDVTRGPEGADYIVVMREGETVHCVRVSAEGYLDEVTDLETWREFSVEDDVLLVWADE